MKSTDPCGEGVTVYPQFYGRKDRNVEKDTECRGPWLRILIRPGNRPSYAQEPAQTNHQQDEKMKDDKMKDDKMMGEKMQGKKGKHKKSKKKYSDKMDGSKMEGEKKG